MVAPVLKMASVNFPVLLIVILVWQKTQAELEVPLQLLNSGDLRGEPEPEPEPSASASEMTRQDETGGWGTGLCEGACTCGMPNRKTRIAGGRPLLANEYRYPWAAGLRQFGRIFCGGVLITNRHVLTSAQCVRGNILMMRLLTTVIVGERDRFIRLPNAVHRMSNILRFSDFELPVIPGSSNYDNDIALLILVGDVTLNKRVYPICLPLPGEDFTGRTGTAIGWGRKRETQLSLIQELMVVDIPILEQKICRVALNYESASRNPKVADAMMCAGLLEGRAGPCGVDRGGPLMVIDSRNRTVVAGVMSWSEGCARPHRPAVYTRVGKYLPWIKRYTKEACFCK